MAPLSLQQRRPRYQGYPSWRSCEACLAVHCCIQQDQNHAESSRVRPRHCRCPAHGCGSTTRTGCGSTTCGVRRCRFSRPPTHIPGAWLQTVLGPRCHCSPLPAHPSPPRGLCVLRFGGGFGPRNVANFVDCKLGP